MPKLKVQPNLHADQPSEHLVPVTVDCKILASVFLTTSTASRVSIGSSVTARPSICPRSGQRLQPQWAQRQYCSLSWPFGGSGSQHARPSADDHHWCQPLALTGSEIIDMGYDQHLCLGNTLCSPEMNSHASWAPLLSAFDIVQAAEWGHASKRYGSPRSIMAQSTAAALLVPEAGCNPSVFREDNQRHQAKGRKYIPAAVPQESMPTNAAHRTRGR